MEVRLGRLLWQVGGVGGVSGAGGGYAPGGVALHTPMSPQPYARMPRPHLGNYHRASTAPSTGVRSPV